MNISDEVVYGYLEEHLKASLITGVLSCLRYSFDFENNEEELLLGFTDKLLAIFFKNGLATQEEIINLSAQVFSLEDEDCSALEGKMKEFHAEVSKLINLKLRGKNWSELKGSYLAKFKNLIKINGSDTDSSDDERWATLKDFSTSKLQEFSSSNFDDSIALLHYAGYLIYHSQDTEYTELKSKYGLTQKRTNDYFTSCFRRQDANIELGAFDKGLIFNRCFEGDSIKDIIANQRVIDKSLKYELKNLALAHIRKEVALLGGHSSKYYVFNTHYFINPASFSTISLKHEIFKPFWRTEFQRIDYITTLKSYASDSDNDNVQASSIRGSWSGLNFISVNAEIQNLFKNGKFLKYGEKHPQMREKVSEIISLFFITETSRNIATYVTAPMFLEILAIDKIEEISKDLMSSFPMTGKNAVDNFRTLSSKIFTKEKNYDYSVGSTSALGSFLKKESQLYSDWKSKYHKDNPKIEDKYAITELVKRWYGIKDIFANNKSIPSTKKLKNKNPYQKNMYKEDNSSDADKSSGTEDAKNGKNNNDTKLNEKLIKQNRTGDDRNLSEAGAKDPYYMYSIQDIKTVQIALRKKYFSFPDAVADIGDDDLYGGLAQNDQLILLLDACTSDNLDSSLKDAASWITGDVSSLPDGTESPERLKWCNDKLPTTVIITLLEPEAVHWRNIRVKINDDSDSRNIDILWDDPYGSNKGFSDNLKSSIKTLLKEFVRKLYKADQSEILEEVDKSHDQQGYGKDGWSCGTVCLSNIKDYLTEYNRSEENSSFGEISRFTLKENMNGSGTESLLDSRIEHIKMHAKVFADKTFNEDEISDIRKAISDFENFNDYRTSAAENINLKDINNLSNGDFLLFLSHVSIFKEINKARYESRELTDNQAYEYAIQILKAGNTATDMQVDLSHEKVTSPLHHFPTTYKLLNEKGVVERILRLSYCGKKKTEEIKFAEMAKLINNDRNSNVDEYRDDETSVNRIIILKDTNSEIFKDYGETSIRKINGLSTTHTEIERKRKHYDIACDEEENSKSEIYIGKRSKKEGMSDNDDVIELAKIFQSKLKFPNSHSGSADYKNGMTIDDIQQNLDNMISKNTMKPDAYVHRSVVTNQDVAGAIENWISSDTSGSKTKFLSVASVKAVGGNHAVQIEIDRIGGNNSGLLNIKINDPMPFMSKEYEDGITSLKETIEANIPNANVEINNIGLQDHASATCADMCLILMHQKGFIDTASWALVAVSQGESDFSVQNADSGWFQTVMLGYAYSEKLSQVDKVMEKTYIDRVYLRHNTSNPKLKTALSKNPIEWDKADKKALKLALHPDKNGNSEQSKKDFQLVNGVIENIEKHSTALGAAKVAFAKVSEEINRASKEVEQKLGITENTKQNICKVGGFASKATTVFKAGDVLIDSVRMVSDPSMQNIQKTALDSAHLYSSVKGVNYFSVAITTWNAGSAAISSASPYWEKSEYGSAALYGTVAASGVIAESAMYMAIPVVLASFNPILGTGYTIYIAGYAGHHFYNNVSALYHELTDKGETLEENIQYFSRWSNIDSFLSYTPLQLFHDFEDSSSFYANRIETVKIEYALNSLNSNVLAVKHHLYEQNKLGIWNAYLHSLSKSYMLTSLGVEDYKIAINQENSILYLNKGEIACGKTDQLSALGKYKCYDSIDGRELGYITVNSDFHVVENSLYEAV